MATRREKRRKQGFFVVGIILIITTVNFILTVALLNTVNKINQRPFLSYETEILNDDGLLICLEDVSVDGECMVELTYNKDGEITSQETFRVEN